MTAPAEAARAAFAESRARFEALVGFLDSDAAAGLQHGELEDRLQADGRELLRCLAQDHLDLRALREQRIDEIADRDGVPRTAVEGGHERSLSTVFGGVSVSRLAYRRRGCCNLHPADALLNLPEERHSHGLRRVTAIESSRGSFDDAVEAIERICGQRLGKRQVEQLAAAAAVDFDAFYEQREPAPSSPAELLVLSCDGKGIVMRPDALRPQTAKQAARASCKLKSRLSKGEKRNRKRMAEVGAVYAVVPVARTPADVMPATDEQRSAALPGPVAIDKWLIASVIEDAGDVVARVFDEAERRDPDHQCTWVALVDGNTHQIDRIHAEANARGVTIRIVVDFIHVLEYLWKAAWSFHQEGDPAAEDWVGRHACKILAGHARQVAATIRRAATKAGLTPARRAGADKCAAYLTNKHPHLDYPTALTAGWPIATGVIEGACRHLVKDRMDITGARWGLHGAEAILKLRAVLSNGDFDDYWAFHLAREHERVHLSRYADNTLPDRVTTAP
jgi:hypothetical protein